MAAGNVSYVDLWVAQTVEKRNLLETNFPIKTSI
jgi:hypothetical protein